MTEYEKKSLALLCVIAHGINRLASATIIQSRSDDEVKADVERYNEAKKLVQETEKALKTRPYAGPIPPSE